MSAFPQNLLSRNKVTWFASTAANWNLLQQDTYLTKLLADVISKDIRREKNFQISKISHMEERRK